MPNAGKCAGEEFAAFAGMGIISSYLLLFISFYLATYKKAGKTGRPRRNTGKLAAIAMKNAEVPSIGDAAHTAGFDEHKPNGNVATTGRSNGGPVTRSRKA